MNVIDLEAVNDKVRERKYESTVDFWNDIKWIQHNVHILNVIGLSNCIELK